MTALYPQVGGITSHGERRFVTIDPTAGTSEVAFTLPEKADLVWTSQNYHDFHLKKFGMDVAAIDKAIYDALRPGGLFDRIRTCRRSGRRSGTV